MTLAIADILAAARIGHEAVTALCERAGLTDAELRAEIERIAEEQEDAPLDFMMVRGMPVLTSFLESVVRASVAPLAPATELHTARDYRRARAALEAELARRAAAPATHVTPEPT